MTWSVIVIYVTQFARQTGELTERARDGDTLALGQLYELFLDRIFRFIRFRVSTAEDAEDITQEVFLKMWRGLKSYRAGGVPFEAWLFKIARNSVIDHYRKQKPAISFQNAPTIADTKKSPQDTALESISKQEVLNKLKKLKPAYQEIIILKFIEERETKEISAIMDKPAAHIRVLQSRALNALRKVINN